MFSAGRASRTRVPPPCERPVGPPERLIVRVFCIRRSVSRISLPVCLVILQLHLCVPPCKHMRRMSGRSRCTRCPVGVCIAITVICVCGVCMHVCVIIRMYFWSILGRAVLQMWGYLCLWGITRNKLIVEGKASWAGHVSYSFPASEPLFMGSGQGSKPAFSFSAFCFSFFRS